MTMYEFLTAILSALIRYGDSAIWIGTVPVA